MIIFFKILLAHLFGDFIFQSNKWVADKNQHKHKSKYLYFHSLLHGLLAWLLVFRVDFWPYAIVIMVSHYLIDLMKLTYQKDETQKSWFFIDQFLHISILAIVSWAFLGFEYLTVPYLPSQFWLILIAVTFLTTPSSIVIKMLISTWTPMVGANDDSLQNAGKYIGILERLLIFTFILTQHWEGIGFLIAAKSIFRFGDLQESKDRKLTEYILIGTLLSFSLAVFTGLLLSISIN
jgi:hypothetical protein